MIRRLSIALIAAAALGGCATYGYSGGDDGDYYYGSPGTDYYYGAPYGSVGYYGGYGSTRYGYGYGGYGYGYGPGYGYYPPYYYYPRPEPRPPRPPVPPRWPDGLAPDNGVRYPSRGYDGAYGRPQVTSPGAPQAGGRGGVISRGYEEGTRTPPPQARPYESRGRLGEGAMPPPRQMAPQQPMQQRPFESRGRPSEVRSAPAPRQEMRSAPAPRQEMRSAPAPRQEVRSAPMRSASPNRDDRRSREP